MIHITEPITFITGNEDKAKWTERYIHVPMTHTKLDLTEIQSLDSREVVEHKVKEAYKILGKPVLVEDTSFVINSLGRLPGTLIKWFLEEIGNVGLCRITDPNDRSAVAKVMFGIYDGTNLAFFEGESKGKIVEKPVGESGFGWDKIYIPDGQNKTHGEMTDEEMDKISIRKIALNKLKDYLIHE